MSKEVIIHTLIFTFHISFIIYHISVRLEAKLPDPSHEYIYNLSWVSTQEREELSILAAYKQNKYIHII